MKARCRASAWRSPTPCGRSLGRLPGSPRSYRQRNPGTDGRRPPHQAARRSRRIDQADHHVHPGAVVRRGRNQRLPGSASLRKRAIAAGLDHPQPGIIQHRHLAEWVPGEVLWRLGFARKHVERPCPKSVHTLLGQQHLDRPDVGGAVEAVERDWRHHCVFSGSYSGAPARSRGAYSAGTQSPSSAEPPAMDSAKPGAGRLP